MRFKPSIIVDKSTIQGLTNEETKQLKRHIKIVITPPLIRELFANLNGKDALQEKSRKKVSGIAKNLIEMDPVFQYSIESLVAANLFGYPVPMDGTPFLFNSQLEYKEGHTFIKESEPSIILRRWANMEFNADDFKIGEYLKNYHQSVDLNLFKEKLNSTLNPPKFDSLDSVLSNKVIEVIKLSTMVLTI